MIDTCFNTHHLLFGRQQQHSGSARDSYSGGLVGWLDTKKFEATGDRHEVPQGWTPTIANVSGTGKREPFVGPDQPIEPGKDKWVKAAFYALQPTPGHHMGTGDGARLLTRIEQTSIIIG